VLRGCLIQVAHIEDAAMSGVDVPVFPRASIGFEQVFSALER
jgi:hypothetical protein